MNPADLIHFIQSRRFSLEHEKTLQAEIADAMTAAGIAYRREVNLGQGDIIDFIVAERIGMEVKIRGRQGKRDIYRQCARYCTHDLVQEFVLVSNVSMTMPQFIAGRPVFVASLSRGWL